MSKIRQGVIYFEMTNKGGSSTRRFNEHKKQIEKSIKQGKEPYFIKDNKKVIEGIITATKLSTFSERPHYGSAIKLGRSATKEAKKIYENIPAPILSRDVQKNTAKIASVLGVKQGNPMTFLEANEGRANININ